MSAIADPIEKITSQAASLEPIQRLEAVERIISTLDLNNPALADVYERIANVEASVVADSIDSGEMETIPFDSMMDSLRQRYGN